jgi:hypothetical protein
VLHGLRAFLCAGFFLLLQSAPPPKKKKKDINSHVNQWIVFWIGAEVDGG